MDEEIRQRRVLTPEQAYVKIRHFCAFQERTHLEVKRKLSGYGISWTQAGELLSKLIEEGFLNEERFARSFAGGKFRMKGWGRKKIEMELKMRMISDYSIRVAIREEIDPAEYEKTLTKLVEKKWNSLKSPGDTFYTKQAKTRQYLLGRGYENDWISRIMKKFIDGQTNDNNHSD
jgi:regulatory protein